MIQTVLKRDGRIVGFNEEKIATAIRKAMLHTDSGEDMQLIHQITDRIAFKGNEQMTVEAIQDMVEMELMKHLPADIIPKAHHWLILHGRYTCTARKPKCVTCGLQDICLEYISTHTKI